MFIPRIDAVVAPVGRVVHPSGGGGARGHRLDYDRSWSATNERGTAGGGSGGVENDPATETGLVAAAATEAAAGNRGGRQQSTTSGSTSILHEIITV